MYSQHTNGTVDVAPNGLWESSDDHPNWVNGPIGAAPAPHVTDFQTSSGPALGTCAGARAKWDGLYGTPCTMEQVTRSDGTNDTAHTPASCGNSTECKDWISSIDDTNLAKMQTGFQSCAKVTGYEGYAIFAVTINYGTINQISDGCGFPAGTVTASPPGLDTCAGAKAKWDGLFSTPCPMEKYTRSDGTNDTHHTPASCGNSTECKDYISSFNDNVLASIQTGFQACANVAGYEYYADVVSSVTYGTIKQISDGCGFPAGTVAASG